MICINGQCTSTVDGLYNNFNDCSNNCNDYNDYNDYNNYNNLIYYPINYSYPRRRYRHYRRNPIRQIKRYGGRHHIRNPIRQINKRW